MRVKNILPITEARKNIFALAEKVQDQKTCYTLTEHGRPKAVLVAAEKFEALSEKKSTEFLLADGGGKKYDCKKTEGGAPLIILRDLSGVSYVSKFFIDSERNRKELIKAKMLVDLVEKHRYPLDRLELNKVMQLGKTTPAKLVEIDILASDRNGRPEVFFAAALPERYEQERDETVRSFFELSKGLFQAGQKKLFFVYYTLGKNFEDGLTEEKLAVIDCARYRNFYAWKTLGRPLEKEIPKLSSL